MLNFGNQTEAFLNYPSETKYLKRTVINQWYLTQIMHVVTFEL